MLLVITNKMDSYLQFLTVLLLFVFVLGITWLTTRWMARYQKDRNAAGNIEIVETCRISANKYIQIVRAGEQYLVIAVGKDEVHMLTKLSRDELVIQDRSGQGIDFAAVLDRVKKLKQNEKDD